MKPIGSRSWLIGGMAGAATGAVVAFLMTLSDWRLNPAGLFHDEQGTDWGVVLETAVSWFLPIALIVFALVTAVHHWHTSRPIRE